MAQKKNSKKDLGKRVEKLRKKIATLSSGLTKKQSELSRTLSAVQKKLDKVRKQNIKFRKEAARFGKQSSKLSKQSAKLNKQADKLSKQRPKLKEFSSQGERYAALIQTTEGLAARLQEVEKSISAVERAGDGIQERTRLLETGAAEAAMQVEVAAEGGPDSDLEHSVALLRERTGALENQLNRLHMAQDGLELQIALLSREAEVEGDASAVSAAPVSGVPTTTDEFLKQLPVLRSKLGHAEEEAEKLVLRTAQLEGDQESLSEQDRKLAAQLQELEQRVSELSGRMEESAASQILPVLEEHLLSLSTDRSRDQSRIEDILSKADELEKAKLNYTRHTDVLADRVSGISDRLEQLLAADPERRLDELERRGSALERSISGEQERLDALDESGQTLGQQLLSAIDDTASVDDRVRALGKTDEQLGGEIDRLEVALREADQNAREHHERLQAHEVRLEEQRQRLDDAIESQKKAAESLNARLATLEDSRQSLQEAADGLRVQQVRQDHDTQALHQSLQRRSLVGLLLLLAAGVLGFLMPRGTDVSADLHTLQQATGMADRQARTLIADLQQDMGMLRSEVLALSESVAGLNRAVEEITADDSAGAGGTSAGLAKLVESLEQQGQVSEQERQALRSTQDEQRQQTTALMDAQDVQRQENAALRQWQEKLQAEVETIASEVKELSKEADEKPAAAVGTPGVWADAQNSRRYTIQLVGTHGHGSLNRFLERHDLGVDSAVYNTSYKGNPWHVVFYGIYATVEQAQEAAARLPAELTAAGPWVRRIPKSGEIHPR